MIGVEIAKLDHQLNCASLIGVERTDPLFRQSQTTGPPSTEFIPSAAWKSPSLADH